jgi:hypothetical protein
MPRASDDARGTRSRLREWDDAATRQKKEGEGEDPAVERDR